jgi:hypothetical protein
MQIFKDGNASIEYIGLRTKKENTSDELQKLTSESVIEEERTSHFPLWTICGSYDCNDPEDINTVDSTDMHDPPVGPKLIIDQVGDIIRSRFPADSATYRCTVYADVNDTRVIDKTGCCIYTLYSVYGELLSVDKYSQNVYWQEGGASVKWPDKYTTIGIPDWNSKYYPDVLPYPVGWSDAKKEAYSKPRYESMIAGEYSDNAIVNCTIVQHNIAEQGSTSSPTVSEIWDFFDRVVTVHAQAKHVKSRVTSFDWIEKGRNVKLESSITEAVNYAYELNSIPLTETRDLTVEIKMFTKRLPEEEIHE